jgi:DNA repair exonuclease SbcCD ATPase subunit
LQNLDLRPCASSHTSSQSAILSIFNEVGTKCPYSIEKVNSTLKSRMKRLEEEIQCLKGTTEDFEFGDIFVQSQKRFLGEKIKELKFIESQNKDLKNLNSQILTLTSENSKLSQDLRELSSLKSQNIRLNQELTTFKSQNFNLNQELTMCKSQSFKMNQDLHEAQNSNEKLDKNFKKAETEIKKLRQELNHATDIIKAEKNDIIYRINLENENLRQSSIESNNNTLDDLQSEKLMNNFVMFIVLPLVCLITLINIVVYVSCCVFKTETEIDDKKAIAEEPGVNRTAWMNQIREDFDKF